MLPYISIDCSILKGKTGTMDFVNITNDHKGCRINAVDLLSFENEKLKYQTLSSESPLFMRILFFLFCQSFLFSV